MVFLSNIFTDQVTWIVIWVIVFLIALVIELSTEQLVSIWFSGSALLALILASCGVVWWIQTICFIVLAGILLAVSKILIKKDQEKDVPTNADSLIGSEIIVTKSVNANTYGEGKIRDIVWTVAIDNDEEIIEGETAIVKAIVGNHLVIEKKGK